MRATRAAASRPGRSYRPANKEGIEQGVLSKFEVHVLEILSYV